MSGNETITFPRVALVIVNYRGREDTLACLESVATLTYPDRDVLLIDQDSKDGTPEAVRGLYPWVHIIENPVNNGFAGGNNLGIRVALEQRGADYIFLLNNDTTVEPGLLEPLIALAEGDSAIGIVGPKMLYFDRPDVIWSAGGRIDWRGGSLLIGEGEPDDTKETTTRDVDFIVGCGLLVKRAVLERIGLFDERYFLYYEETDLCARARKAGWRIVYQPAARLWHKVSGSTGGDSELTLYYMRRNVLLYLGERGTRPFLGCLTALGESLRLALVWAVQGKRRRSHVILRAVLDYLRGRFGKTDFVFR